MSEIVKQLSYQNAPHEPDAPALALRGIYVAYASASNNSARAEGGGYALEAVAFQAQKGERVAIVGPNGAGKSTLLKLIAGIMKPARGDVDVYGHGPRGHICIAYVPQRNQIDWTFPATVEDVVMMGRVGQIGLFRWPRRRDWALARESLARVNASHLAKKQIGELSGGQQQRVFIARALAQEAALLLLDEPLTGLDAPSQEAIFKILDGLRSDGVTALVATHDLNLAAKQFDQVMLLNRRIVAYGDPTAVLSTDNLLQAYGGHMHIIGGNEEMVLADTCCEH